MSDGISDANASAQLDSDVWTAAFDAKEACANLVAAMQRAKMGHRGWGTPLAMSLAVVNQHFGDFELELVNRGDATRAFGHWPEAYAPRKSRRELSLEREVEALKARIAELESKPDPNLTGEAVKSSPENFG